MIVINDVALDLPALVHLCVVFFILARGDIVHPLLVVQIPADGLFDTFFELEARFPAQFGLQLVGIDGIAQVVSGAVGHVGNELLACPLWVAQQTVNGFDDHLHDINILPFVETADIVGVTNLALVEDDIDSSGVVDHIQPVAHVFAFAVDGQRFAVADVVDEKGNELLRELVGAVVVGAVGDQRGHAVGIVVGAHEVV